MPFSTGKVEGKEILGGSGMLRFLGFLDKQHIKMASFTLHNGHVYRQEILQILISVRVFVDLSHMQQR
jgi:hypothetical protein